MYFDGSADFSIFTASKVSCPVPCKTESTDWLYIASKVLAMGAAFGFRPPTPKSLMLFKATAGSLPERIRGREGPKAMARKADRFAASGRECKARFSQPSGVFFRPGVPDSMKSCASKCERDESGEPAACTIASWR